jgi:hypothetical protein
VILVVLLIAMASTWFFAKLESMMYGLGLGGVYDGNAVNTNGTITMLSTRKTAKKEKGLNLGLVVKKIINAYIYLYIFILKKDL